MNLGIMPFYFHKLVSFFSFLLAYLLSFFSSFFPPYIPTFIPSSLPSFFFSFPKYLLSSFLEPGTITSVVNIQTLPAFIKFTICWRKQKLYTFTKVIIKCWEEDVQSLIKSYEGRYLNSLSNVSLKSWSLWKIERYLWVKQVKS